MGLTDTNVWSNVTTVKGSGTDIVRIMQLSSKYKFMRR